MCCKCVQYAIFNLINNKSSTTENFFVLIKKTKGFLLKTNRKHKKNICHSMNREKFCLNDHFSAQKKVKMMYGKAFVKFGDETNEFWNILNTFIRLTCGEANYYISVNIFAPFIPQWKKTFGFGTKQKKIMRLLYLVVYIWLVRKKTVCFIMLTNAKCLIPHSDRKRRAIMSKQKMLLVLFDAMLFFTHINDTLSFQNKFSKV